MDPRKAFVLNSIVGAIAPLDQKDAYVEYLAQDSNGSISSFLDDGSVSLLQASVSGLGTGSLQLSLSNIPEFPEGCEFQVVIIKLRPGTVSEADIPANLSVSTVSHSAISSLYHALKDLYSPLLGLSNAHDAGGMDGRLQDLIMQVQAGLGAAVRKNMGQPATQAVQDPNKAPLQDILTPLDEVAFWSDLATNPSLAGTATRAAGQVHIYFEPLRAPFEEMLTGKLEGGWEGVKEVIDQTLSALRQVWPIKLPNGAYAMGQARCCNFLCVTGAAVASYVQAHLKGVNLWSGNFNEIKTALIGASQVLSRWASECKGLTQDWLLGIDNGGHDWEGSQPFKDPFVFSFQERMEEIYLMRDTHDELTKLLGSDIAGSLGTSDVFSPFAHLAPLQVSEYTLPAWRAAREEYERRMDPIEQRVSQKLKELFGSTILPSLMAAVSASRGAQSVGSTGGSLIQPAQVFQELKRYSGLLGRPVIAQALISEKEALAKQIDKHLDNMQTEFDEQRDAASMAGNANSRKGGKGQPAATPGGRNSCNVADQIMWCLQCTVKVGKTVEVLQLMLGQNRGVEDTSNEDPATISLRACLGVAQSLLKEVDDFKKEQFEVWQENTEDQLSDMAQWKNSRLMSFDAQNSHVKTHFNDHLVVLLREVRQLQALGFSVKRDVLTEVDTANRFYRYGMVLKQRANFYNNISTEMIPCQKPMMLKDALEFEKVLMNPKDAQNKEITWRNAAALDGYVRRLNEVADRLAEKNRQLRKWHGVLREKVVTLMGTDLVRYKDRWAQGVKEMREIFVRLESDGYTKESQAVWRQHWDFQLYKALEYQYMQGIECINKTLPEVEIKMVFRQHKLQYDPPLEELRIKHYKDFLNTFLGLPLRMKGVSDLSERQGFFRPIVDSNPAGIARVYTAAEALFNTLGDEIKKFGDWIVMASVNMDEFVDSNLQEVADWELNFRMLKAASKDAERLPNELKVDCYKISMLPVKAAVDEHMKKLQETLVASLRRKAVIEKEQVEEYMKNGSDLFTLQATSVEEIGNAGLQARDMVAGLTDVSQIRRRIDEKNKLLRLMAAGSKDAQFAVVDLGEVNNQWESFTTQLQQYDAHLEEQKSQLAVQITKQLDEFRGKVAGFASRWSELKPQGGPSGNPGVVLTRIEEYSNAILELKEESAKLQKEADAFKLEVGDFETLEEVAADVAITKASWDRYSDFLKERNEMANKDWLSMRDQVWKIEDFLAKWSKAVEGKGADDPIAVILMGEIDTYKRCLPHLKSCMRGAGWEDSHWLQLFQILDLKTTGPNAVAKDTVTLSHFLDAADALVKNADKIKALDSQAQGESMIRKALAEVKLWGMTTDFKLSESVSTVAGRTRKTPLISEWRDVMSEVGDHQSMIASLKGSAYYHLFKDEVSTWEGKLGFLQEGLTLLNQIQRKWVYLEPIFARGALPQQQARFRNVDEEFRRVMGQLDTTKKVVSFADIPGIRDKMPQMAQQLDVCQRALSDFLEEKRSLFPRFYFIGDDDLLEILGQSKNPTVIQSHLKKLFAGIHKVKFSADNANITAMQSMEVEVVELNKGGVPVSESVEEWLGQLSKSMKGTLQSQLMAVRSGSAKDEFQAMSSQVLQLRDCINFTEQVEKGISSNTMPKVLEQWQGQLQRLAAGDFTGHPLLQLKKQALIMDYIHYIDVCEQLLKSRVSALSDWTWRRQLRYYDKGDGMVKVSMAEASFEYSWEYQGNAPKLVYTPLTDKCYLTLTQGMALGYGGNPYGPAGTGKTESVKALGQAFARQVLVFNCDEEFDFKSMGRIFVGLVKCGAWGCFDEFNRLDEEVLSAVSQQIQIIQGALKEGAKQMTFLDKTVEVDKNAGIFVTLNPAGKGYGGRSKLPDNLKQLFRSIAMTVPNNDLIAEVLLVSEGFNTAKDLAKKLVSLFTFSRELLSPQQHYDWGLRALKTTLGIAGKELREARKTNANLDAKQEMEILVRSVCATKLPTLTFDDNKRFRALLGDLFKGAAVTDTKNEALEKAILEVAEELSLELTAQQMEKMMQLHLACEQRIGVIIVGPSGSGKSTLWEVLEKAYEKLKRKPVVYKMNPKGMARQQLLGSMNLDTREWSDGVLTAAARKVVKEPLEQRSWIICDGDVDPEWIESLNSVLDDNRLLTMPNGERIQFANNVNFIFECHSLEFASPATVSRCGMIFLSDEAVDVNRLIRKWLKESPNNDATQMEAFFKDHFPKAFEWALSHPSAVETTKVGMLDAALSHMALGIGSKHDFCAAMARGLGGNMSTMTRRDFLTDLMRYTSEGDLLGGGESYGQDPLACLGDELREKGMGSEPESDVLVMTEEVIQSLTMVAPWFKNREPFILVGPEGCGKSTLLEYCFRRIIGVQVALVNCSAQTSAANVIQKLVQVCGKPVTTNTGKCLRPPDNCRLVLYLKDVNLPKPDKYNTAQLVAFLQQLITHKGYYDENLEFITVDKVQIICSMNPASTVGRHMLSTRFTARVRVAYIDYPEKEHLQAIYTDMVGKRLVEGLSVSAANLAKAMIELYTQVVETFTVNDQPHYQFNCRDITNWVNSLTRYQLEGLSLVEAVAYEGTRIFRDRLVGEAKGKFDNIHSAVMNSHLGWKGDATPWLASTLGASSEDRISCDPGRIRLVKWAAEDFLELVQEKLKGFEREYKELHMLLFHEVLVRVARFDRVLSTPGGSIFLCGQSGVGRRSCMLLMAYMHLMEFVTPKMSRNYDLKSFRNDLKEVLKLAGVQGKKVMLFIEDHQLVQPTFLEYINSLLSGGEIPGLFSNEELAKELMPLEQAKNEDADYNGPASLYAYFTYRVRRNLHIVVSMDPSNGLFRSRCESNPALFSRCSVQWLEAWSTQGMQHIPTVRMQEMVAKNKDVKDAGAGFDSSIVDHMVKMHAMMANLGANSRQYNAFVDLYSRIYSEKRLEVLTQQSFLKGGLSKLAEAESTVATLSKNADKQRALLQVKQAEAEEALGFIQKSMMQAADRSKEVEILKKKTAVEEGVMKERTGGVEEELSSVQPMIDQARAAVGSIKKQNIDEIRSLKMPPDAIRDVLEGVLMMMGQQDISWNNMKKFLGTKAVKDDIVNFDAHRVTKDIRAKVEKLVAAKGNSFEHAVIYRVSVAAAPLASWVKANLAYSKVLEKTAPLEAELAMLLASLDQSKVLIVQYQEELEHCEQQVGELKSTFSKKTSEAESLRSSVEKAEGTVRSAMELLEKLAGEKGRWVTTVKSMDGDLIELPLNALLTSAFITYLPSHPEDVRAQVTQDWLSYLGLREYNFSRFMSSESEMLKWKSEGLPGDSLSMQNAVVILNSTQSPLVIDPSTQASTWLINHIQAKSGDSGSSSSIEVTTMHDQRFTNTLELAVRFGKTLVVQEVDKIEPILYPILRMDLDRQGPRFVVQIGDKQIDFNDTFRLFLVTRNPEPYLPPDARSLVAATNFTVTRSGLEGQLLGLTIEREQPELEAQKSGLLKQEEELKMQLADLERSLLQNLATSTGNILDNKELLDSLNETKSKSTTIAVSLTESKTLQVSLDEQREVYRPIAARGSVMYFLIKDLCTINHVYQFSLGVFIMLFKKALSQDTPPGNVSSRIAVLSDALLELTFAYVSRSLFNSDRLTFGMHMARNLQPGICKQEEWNFFLGKYAVDGSASQSQKPQWVREECASAFALLAANCPQLVAASDLQDAATWSTWGSGINDASDATTLPPKIAGKVNAFQALLLVKSFRPDRLQSAMTSFVCSALNVKSVQPPAFSLKDLITTETQPDQPVLFLTTPGADPSQELGEYAEKSIGRDKYHEVAMGQGQAEIAVQLLRDCARSGEWLVLKNMHLVVGWLPTLEKEVYTLAKNPDFRLFLTSEPHDKFPGTLLEGSLKVTFEAPPGLKKNMLRTYENWSPEYISSGPPLRAQLLFVLAWFHAVTQERRNYIPQGWSKFYEFSPADLRSGTDVIGLSTKDVGKGGAQWEMLHGLLENAIYGGRVDNIFDGKVLRTYLDQFFHPEVVGMGGKARPLPGSRTMVPTSAHRQDYVDIVTNLPETDVPALFSLPANIDRAAQQANSELVVGALKQMSISRSAAMGFNKAQWQAQLSPLLRLWEQLMSQAASLKVAAREIKASKPGANDASSPIDSFVVLERTHGVNLVNTIDSALSAINRVLRGQETLTSTVQGIGGSLMQDMIPGVWDKIWEGPESCSDYCRAVVYRSLAIEDWVKKTASGSLLSSGPMDLSSLYHPGTFLNALRQQTARQLNATMDSLKLATTWDSSGRISGAATTILVGGLLIQGANFDGARMGPLAADSPTSKVVPAMSLAWIPKDSPYPYGSAYMDVPLYTTQDRSKVLTQVQMPVASQEEAGQWILSGIAMFMP